MSSILLYLGLLIVGGFLSFRGWIHKGLSAKIDKLQLACLFALLFVMGMRIGMNDSVLKAFAQIGLHAVLYATFTIVGSVIAVHLLLKVFGKKKEAKQ
ncbi:LysO family transporter [Fusibacter bizertensis]